MVRAGGVGESLAVEETESARGDTVSDVSSLEDTVSDVSTLGDTVSDVSALGDTVSDVSFLGDTVSDVSSLGDTVSDVTVEINTHNYLPISLLTVLQLNYVSLKLTMLLMLLFGVICSTLFGCEICKYNT